MASTSWLWGYGGGIEGGQQQTSPSSVPSGNVNDDQCGGFSNIFDCPTVNNNTGGQDDVRMPELSSPCSSPGARQQDTPEEQTAGIFHTCTFSSPPNTKRATTESPRCKKRTTATEAYNKGLLLQYLVDNASQLDICNFNRDTTTSALDSYEMNWEGHQPLTPSTWREDQEDDDCASIVSASEMRLMRRRRRRGVLSPPRTNSRLHVVSPVSPNKIGNGGDESRSVPGFGIAFPADVADPHKGKQKKWQPSWDGTISVSSSGDSGGTA